MSTFDPDKDLLDKLDRREWEHKVLVVLPRLVAVLVIGALAGDVSRLSIHLNMWRSCEAGALAAILAAVLLFVPKAD